MDEIIFKDSCNYILYYFMKIYLDFINIVHVETFGELLISADDLASDEGNISSRLLSSLLHTSRFNILCSPSCRRVLYMSRNFGKSAESLPSVERR